MRSLPNKTPAEEAAGGGESPVPRLRPADTPPRRGDARARLLAAAAELYKARGFLSVSVDEIAATAGVSRVTFYRQFADKAALTADLFRVVTQRALPRFTSIAERNYRDPAAVAGWIREIFAADQTQPLIRAFTEALVVAPEFVPQAQQFTDRMILELGRHIPAFAADPADPATRRQWLEAWLLLYHILDQSNHAALRSGIASDPLMIDILTDRFIAFVDRYS